MRRVVFLGWFEPDVCPPHLVTEWLDGWNMMELGSSLHPKFGTNRIGISKVDWSEFGLLGGDWNIKKIMYNPSIL